MHGRRTRTPRCNIGFSLVELLVVIAIAAILLGTAAPSFLTTTSDVRLVGEQNRLVKALRLARTEAITTARVATLCASSTGTRCGDDWSEGWLAFTDGSIGTAGSYESTDTLIARYRTGTHRVGIKARALIRPASSMAATSKMSFDSRGRSDWTLGTIVLCDERGADAARAVIVNGAGGLRSVEPEGSAVLDATGTQVTCT